PLSQPWLVEAVSTAEWTGTKLGPLLEEVGLGPDAVEVVFTGADRGIQGGVEQDYARSLTIADAMRPEVMLVHAMNGEPLQPQHGAPLRLLVPGWYGMASVKWLSAVEVLTAPFEGHFQRERYVIAGQPVREMRIRALILDPPAGAGVTRARQTVRGLAWTGTGRVTALE